MKKRLYLCLKNPFTVRDYDRMGIALLERIFELRILDCTSWLMPRAILTRGGMEFPHSAVRKVRTKAEFVRSLDKDGYAIDYVGQFSPSAILLFDALKSRRIKLVAIDSGAYPSPEGSNRRISWLSKLLTAVRHGGLRSHLRARVNRLLLAILPDQQPDIALVSGSYWRTDPRFANARRHYPAHSFDYERFREVNRESVPSLVRRLPEYAVYLDENIAGHEDNIDLGFATPATENCFFPALNRMFERFERASGLKVIVAAYPGEQRGYEERFQGRLIVAGMTAELIKSSRLVFAHASTAISFAILWRRPLVFLTSDEIAKSWYAPWIDAARLIIGARLVNVDHLLTPAHDEAIDQSAYAHYEASFIKAADSPDKPMWEILCDALESDVAENEQGGNNSASRTMTDRSLGLKE
jgi:hypothetical protein